MDVQQIADDAAAIMRTAADEVYQSQLAFATGNFDAYWAAKVKSAEDRLNDEYTGPVDEPTDPGTVHGPARVPRAV